MSGSETAEMNLRTLLFPCYLQLLGVDVRERDCGDESADAAVAMLFSETAAEMNLRTLLFPCYLQLGVDVLEQDCGDESADASRETAEMNLRTMLLPCYLQLLGVDVRERDCGDESADAAVAMLCAADGGRCSGARLRR